MTDIAKALTELNITEWVLRGEPTSETEFNEMFRKVTGSDENDVAIESDDPEDFGVTWAVVSAKKDELVAAEPMRILRAERDRRIAETDWWAGSDHTMTDAQTTYRQALRDITTQTPTLNTAGELQGINWPTKP